MRRLGSYSQKGAVLVFFALLLPIIVFFGGMAIDFGRAYMYKSQLQNAADAAALAGVTAAAARNKARLVEDPEDEELMIVNDADRINKAKKAANVVLTKDTGKASANDENTSLGYTSENDAYYYKVELTDEVKMVFARFFLPKSLFPDDWKVKVSARAWARSGMNDINGGGNGGGAGSETGNEGPDKLTQTAQAVTENTTKDFFDWENELKQIFREQGINLNKDELRAKAREFSFTNEGVQYDYEGNRSEVFNMDGSIEARNQMKDFFINFKQDVHGAVTNNFDVTDLRGLSYVEARNLFYADNKKFENIILPDGTFIAGPITWDELIRRFGSQIGTMNSDTWWRLTNNKLTWDEISESEREIVWNALTSKITAQINVNVAYEKRNVDGLSAREVSLTPQGEPNYQDPLFVRIESEEFNASRVSNTIHDININIKADNTDNNYRPMVFVYDGPRGDIDGGRESGTVVLNLKDNNNFKGIIYAPNSPVKVIGNNNAFRGYIIAKRIIGPNDKDLTDEMPSHQNSETDAALQAFYENLGLKEAKYDNFNVVRLNVYQNPDKDIIYITERAKITI